MFVFEKVHHKARWAEYLNYWAFNNIEPLYWPAMGDRLGEISNSRFAWRSYWAKREQLRPLQKQDGSANLRPPKTSTEGRREYSQQTWLSRMRRICNGWARLWRWWTQTGKWLRSACWINTQDRDELCRGDHQRSGCLDASPKCSSLPNDRCWLDISSS